MSAHTVALRPQIAHGAGIVGRNHAGAVPRWTTSAARAAAVVAAVALGVALLGPLGVSDAGAPAADPITVVVQSGDTVWEVARAHAPAGTSLLEYANEIAVRNEVDPTRLLPGTVLELPPPPR